MASEASHADPSPFPIAIIGAGFGGIAAAIRLKQAGIESFRIFERASEIGGTWRDNTYPGAACDVPSHVYSLSFEPNPDWSHTYSSSWEIQRYLLGLVEKWHLRDRLHLQTAIEDAVFDQDRGIWTLTRSDGRTYEARAVISAVGGLVDPAWPDIEGISSFRGTNIHTARWNHDYDLTGRRVALIGTGASAVQVLPAIAPRVEQVEVFQRTAAWVVPRFDHAYPDWLKRLFARVPLTLQLSRYAKYWWSELRGPIVFLDSRPLSAIGQQYSLWHLRRQVKDPALREKLRPHFQIGCKRILVSDEYWASFERTNVQLETAPIRRIVPAGVETEDGRIHQADAIVYATGFALGLARAPFPIQGRNGRTLDEAWSGGASAYKGVTVSGFPNFFIIMGPNTGPGHTSVLVYSEAQINHALSAIQLLRSEGARYVDVHADVQRRYNEHLQRRMRHTSWKSGCNSWYLSDDGVNRSLYPGPAAEYVARSRFRRADYEVGGGEG